MILSQDTRLLKVTTALKDGVMVLRRLSVTEALDQPYLIQGELLSADISTEIAPKDILGTEITCTIDWSSRSLPPRHFHGVVTGFGRLPDEQRDFRRYRFEAEPAFALLARSMDCRIFQKLSVKDIVTKIAEERGIEPPKFVSPPSGQREYCTQFNETDLDFIARLLDEAGCSYFFVNEEKQDGWTVVGDKSGFADLPNTTLQVRGEQDRLDAATGWSSLVTVQPAKHKAWDFDNLKPGQLKMAESPTTRTTTGLTGKLEVYRWPSGESVRPDGGRGPADLRMRRNEASAETWSGRSEWPALTPGRKVKVNDGEGESPWLLTAVTHEAFDETDLVGNAATGYSNGFSCVPGNADWRGPVRRARPPIPSLQSAIVTGPKGEEQHCDAQGRIKVHFLWDHRDTKKDDSSSCYVRVMQPFSGSWGGAWFLPRIGDEVLIAFLDGDPDRPVCVGSLYNDPAKPFFGFPGEITKTGFRTRSTKGGGKDNAHILSFDDKKGSEKLEVQAEKDYSELVKHDKSVTVKHDQTVTINNNATFTVDGNIEQKVTGKSKTSPQGKRTTTIKGDETLVIEQGNRSAELKMGNEKLAVKMGNMEIEVSMGNITIKAALGTITLEALQGITLKCGPTTSVELTPMGVTTKGMLIESKATLTSNTEGLLSTHKANAMEQIKGPIVMIGS